MLKMNLGYNMTSKKRNFVGTLCCIFGATCWGFSGAFSEALFSNYEIESTWVTSIRMLVAGILLTSIALGTKKLNIKAFITDKKTVLQVVLFALAGLTACQFSYLSAIMWTNSATATVLQNLSVIFVTFYVCISEKKAPFFSDIVCVILATIGVWLIATGGRFGSLTLTPKGLFWGLAAGITASSYSLLSRKPVNKLGAVPATGMGMLIGGVIFSIATSAWHLPVGLDKKAYFFLSFIVLVGTVGAFTLFLKGISMVGAIKSILLSCLEPLTATTLSIFWLHRNFSTADFVGFVCILATVLISTLVKNKKV